MSNTTTPAQIQSATTQSEISTFLECQQKHQYRYSQRLELRDYFNLAFHVGHQFHKFLEKHYDRSLKADQYIEFEMPKEYDYFITAEDQAKLALYAATFESYQEQYRLYYKDEFQILIPPYAPKIEDINVKDFNGFQLTGMIDVLWKENKLLMDHKTKTILSDNANDNMLQLNMYTLLADIPSATIIINQIKKFALRKTIKETTAMFAIRVRQDIKERPEAYFRRVTREITEEDQKCFKAYLLQPVLERIHTIHPSEIVRNYNACNNFGSQCEFYSLCFPSPDGLTPQYTKRAHKHNELA